MKGRCPGPARRWGHILLWLGYKDSNLDYRSQNPTSCQLNDSPSAERELIRIAGYVNGRTPEKNIFPRPASCRKGGSFRQSFATRQGTPLPRCFPPPQIRTSAVSSPVRALFPGSAKMRSGIASPHWKTHAFPPLPARPLGTSLSDSRSALHSVPYPPHFPDKALPFPGNGAFFFPGEISS